MKKVLYYGDYVARTGFATVSHNIIKNIKKHYREEMQIDVIAINYFGQPYYEDDNTYVISAQLNDLREDSHGRNFFLKALSDGDYDGVFICQDIGTIAPIVEVMRHVKKLKREANKKQFKSILYFPIDGKIVYELTKDLEFFDVLVTYTEFGRKEVLRHKPNLNLKVVPHGNNPKDFFPISEDDIKPFRKEFFGDNANKFIISNINRNQPRKDIPSTIFAFEQALKNWDADLPEPFLYLHMHPKDPLGWDLRGLLMQMPLVENKHYKLLPKSMEDELTDVETLNKIYNASDCMITTTLGEGWGLTFSESAACKKPIIAPFSTSFMEMSDFGNNAFMLTTFYPFCSPVDNVIREQVDIYEVAEYMQEVCRMKKWESHRLAEKVHRNYDWACKLNWDEVCKRWIEYFKIF